MTRRYCPEPVDPRTRPLSPEHWRDRQRLEALQDAVAQFNDNFKHAVLTGRKVDYAPPPPWLPPLVRSLNAALDASKVS